MTTSTRSADVERRARSSAARAARGAVRPRLARADPLGGRARARLGARARAGDGVVGGVGRVDGRPVACYAQDASFLGGSLGAAHADTIDRVLRARRPRRACRSSASSSPAARACRRARPRSAATGGSSASNVALSGVVPQISIICGAVGRRRLLLARADRLRRDDARTRAMFLTGPASCAR